MRILFLLVLLSSSVALAYEVYDPNSGGTFYVKWCNPVKDEINDLHYIQCGDSGDTKLPFRGACSNLQSDCGASPPYPVQIGDSKSRDFVKAKKQWEYFNLNQAAKVGYPGTYEPASMGATAGDRERPQRKSPVRAGNAIKKP